MTFLNWTILFGLIGIAIPIIIHLLNRRRAKMVDWGAMQFLLASLASRNRRIMIEEMILMALRCLIVALLVLAMARPFLPARSTVPWPIVVPAVLIAAMCIGVAAAMWTLRRARWILLAVAAGLLGLAGASAATEHWTQLRRWSSGAGARDIVIVIDGSASMKLEVEGKTNFARAIEETRTLVDLRRSDDAIALFIAGAVPRPVLPTPTNSDKDILAALDELSPTGGSMRVLEALNAAAASLAEGHNPGKQIVLITDAQDLGWDLRSEARWRFLAAGLGNLPSKPKVICRRLAMPETFRNAAITDVTLSRKLIGTDRPVEIDVKVMNTGSVPLEGVTVELSVDGMSATQRELQPLAPNAAETVNFSHRFQRPGPRVVTARLVGADELAGFGFGRQVLPLAETRLPLVAEQEVDESLGHLGLLAEHALSDGDVSDAGHLVLLEEDRLDLLGVPVLEDPPADYRVHVLKGYNLAGLGATLGVGGDVGANFIGQARFIQNFRRVKPDTDRFRVGNGNPEAGARQVFKFTDVLRVAFLNVNRGDKINDNLFSIRKHHALPPGPLHEIRGARKVDVALL